MCDVNDLSNVDNLTDDSVSDIENDLLYLSDYEKQLVTAFEHPDVAFVFNDSRGNERKLYVKKEQLSKISPVFAAMFSSNFKEASAKEISLPGKKLSTFMHFLRLALPGQVDELKADIAHLVLPYVEEYQTEDLKQRIDQFLSTETRSLEGHMSKHDLVEKMIEAEKYTLNGYLEACIGVATRQKTKDLTSVSSYDTISKETQVKIAHQRLEAIEKLYEESICLTNRYDDWRYDLLYNHPKGSLSSNRCQELMRGIEDRFAVYMK